MATVKLATSTKWPARSASGWVNPAAAVEAVRSKLVTWLADVAEEGANYDRQELPVNTGQTRSWVNAAVNVEKLRAAHGIIRNGKAAGPVPTHAAMIEAGITGHRVSLRHTGIRNWIVRAIKRPVEKTTTGRWFWRPKPRGRPLFYLPTWYRVDYPGRKGPRRELRGGRVAIPWLSRAQKRLLPFARRRLRELGVTARRPQ